MSQLLESLAIKLKEINDLDKESEINLALFPHERRYQDNPKINSIVESLEENLLLVEPTLRFIQRKQQEIAEATLVALYGREEFERMKAAEMADQEQTG